VLNKKDSVFDGPLKGIVHYQNEYAVIYLVTLMSFQTNDFLSNMQHILKNV